MKLTNVLCKQHIGKHFIKHWQIQGKKKVFDTGVEDILTKKGITVERAESYLKERKPFQKFEIVGILPEQIKFDNTHPNWHDRICHTYKDNNVLLQGLNQAKIITKTVELENNLPNTLKLIETNKSINHKVKQIILNSHVFDTEQQKLPKIKDPLRPAWNFPRTYGITQNRVNTLMTLKLLQLIELSSGLEIAKQRSLLSDLHFSFPFEKLGNLIQFELKSDVLISSTNPLSPITSVETENIELPNIHPIKETITLNLENIYEIRNLYPIKKNMSKIHPHTIFIHYNPQEVKNLYEEEVTENQIYGRSLLKTFTVAASYARLMHGENVKKLSKPVTVQCVHTDGRLFHFGVLQLNTLELEGIDGVKNIWYQTERIPLFDKCCYENGKPVLEGYNSKVINNLLTFYHNI